MNDDYKHLIPFGYAPGYYTAITLNCCGVADMKIDKRAWRCKACAQIAYNENEQRLDLRRLPNLDTNTRQLKNLRSLGIWSTSFNKEVCDHCALINICDSEPRTHCSEFMPVLPFQGDTGFTEGNVVNTVRVGRAWVARLVVGSTVALFNAKKKEVFTYARVIGLDHGPIDDMLNVHAASNHLHIKTLTPLAPALLKEWLTRNYGPSIIHDKTHLTAIYLLPQHGEASPPNFERDEADRSAESCTEGAG